MIERAMILRIENIRCLSNDLELQRNKQDVMLSSNECKQYKKEGKQFDMEFLQLILIK